MTFLRSKWFPVAMVAAAALAAVLYVDHLRRAAERGLLAERELRAQATDAKLKAEDLLAAERVNSAEMKRQAELAIERWGLSEAARRAEKAAPGSKPVAVLDLHTGPVVARRTGSSESTPVGQGSAAGAPSAGQGRASGGAAPSCSVLEGDQLDFGTGGPVMRSPDGSEAWILKLSVTNRTAPRQGLVGEGEVNPDLSKVTRLVEDLVPPPDPSGWIVGIGGAPLGQKAIGGNLVTPPLRVPRWVPLAGGRAVRWWAVPVVLATADGKGLEWLVITGPAVELGGRR